MSDIPEPEPSVWLLPTVNDMDEHGFESALNALINVYATRGQRGSDRPGNAAQRPHDDTVR